jgi:hypothetical protein
MISASRTVAFVICTSTLAWSSVPATLGSWGRMSTGIVRVEPPDAPATVPTLVTTPGLL